ncbi:unnamed protein product [Didymodactylos carnosus]|uniref:4a-hydroxytetrahydrobiopterin dehydratase n=1 Tax=Didymodactylos carnosus TaxID=1234261 RepID=A0A813SFV9_9BILA|nr:unnamed protein product [Didymodactylos carnosus]CAF0921794.1 unnamed protein product [Didymodactylos carnosus]CAF3580277.1 unnamed protein product [Didymodactylos carnosus]CAF3699212.1 unnamed protein product [Didymodactylos carnosus]
MSVRLEADERDQSLRELVENGWTLNDVQDTINKTFKFDDFNSAFGFMTRVALLAEKLKHHPEWTNIYNKVDVKLTTHDLKALSKSDVQMALFMDHIYVTIGD